MPVEITVKVSDSDRSLVKKRLVYEPFEMSEHSTYIAQMVKEDVKEFNDTPDSIIVKTKMVWE